jgi:hypothetical protein
LVKRGSDGQGSLLVRMRGGIIVAWCDREQAALGEAMSDERDEVGSFRDEAGRVWLTIITPTPSFCKC